jgi:hypothetical protein
MAGGDLLYMQGATVPITMVGQQTAPAPVQETQPQEPQNGT